MYQLYLSKYKYIFMDVDDTILYHESSYWKNSKRYVLSLLPINEKIREEIYHIKGFDSMIRFLYNVKLLNKNTILEKQIEEYLFINYTDQAKLILGVKEFLEKLNKNKIFPIIISGNKREYIESALYKLGILNCFGSIHTIYDIGSNKDSKKFYNEVLLIHEAQISESIIFDDIESVLLVQKEIGFSVVPVARNLSKYTKLSKNFDFIIESYKEVDVIFRSGE